MTSIQERGNLAPRQRRLPSALTDELRAAVDNALRRLSPKSAMAKALAYGRKRWIALTRFLDDGFAEIDNNITERAMRSVAPCMLVI